MNNYYGNMGFNQGMVQPAFGQPNPNSAAAIYQQQQAQMAFNQYQQQQQAAQQEALRRQAMAQQQQMFAQQQMNMMNQQQMQNQNMMFQQPMQYNPYQQAQNNTYNMNLPQYAQQPQPQTNSISSWGQGSAISGKYRPKTEPSNQYQSQQTYQSQPTQTQPATTVTNDETQKRIERLEDENLILKEKINMLTKALYKNQPYKFLIGKTESEKVTMNDDLDSNGKVTHTLYGKDYDNTEIKILPVTPHLPKDIEGKCCLFVDPTSPDKGTEVNNIIHVGESIAEDVMSNTIQSNTNETIYSHRVKVGQVLVIGNDENLNKYAKDLVESEVGEDGEVTNEIIREKSKIIASEFESYLTSFKNAKSVKDVANFLCNTEDEIRRTGKALKNYTIPLKLVEYLKENFRIAYNDFARINLGLSFDPIAEFTAQAAIEADKGLKGEYVEFPRTPEEITKYSESVGSLIFNFLHGIKLLKLGIDYSDDEVNVMIKTIVDMSVYSVILKDQSDVKELTNEDDGIYIVSPESHKKVYSILESIMAYHFDIVSSYDEDGNYNRNTFIHNMVVRFSTPDNGLCVAYKAYKVIKGNRPIFVLKKIYQSF